MMGAAVLMAFAAACTPAVEPVRHEAPEVEFPMADEHVDATVGVPVTFTANVVSGDRLSCGWYVDDVMESSSATMTYTFSTPGKHTVTFTARNGAGSVSKTYSVQVTDVFRMHLSTLDSTEIKRKELGYLKLMAIVDEGSNVTHLWEVRAVDAGGQAGNEVLCSGDEAFFDSFWIPAAGSYSVSYKGSNPIDEFEKTVTLIAEARPLEITFSNEQASFSGMEGFELELSAEIVAGNVGVTQSWTVDDGSAQQTVSNTLGFSHVFDAVGEYRVIFKAENSLGESVTREWLVYISSSGLMFDNFESGQLVSGRYVNRNEPGVSLVENPAPDNVNGSKYVLMNKVRGTHSTSGYFDISLAGLDIDISGCDRIRIKYLMVNGNQFYPRVDIGGTKIPSVTPPQFTGGWEILEYQLSAPIGTRTSITLRPMLKEDGTNVDANTQITATEDVGVRYLYIDDIEFIPAE